MRTFAIAAVAYLLLTGVGFSQMQGGENANTLSEKQDSAMRRAIAEQKKQKAVDEQYQAILGKTKAPPPADPWGNVRSASPSTNH